MFRLRSSEECPPPIEPFNKLEMIFCIPVRSPPFSFKFIQLKGRPSVDVTEAMTGMHKEEEG